MDDGPLDAIPRSPYDPPMEFRVARLEDEMREVKSSLIRVETGLNDLRQTVARIEAMFGTALPHLATKSDLAEKPSKAYLWGVLAVLLTAYASGLAALAVLK